MIGFTRSIAIELGSDVITVNAVCPNRVTTGFGAKQDEYYAKVQRLTPEEFQAARHKRIPLDRPGLPEDTAVAFLASDGARYITGDAMNVSDGRTGTVLDEVRAVARSASRFSTPAPVAAAAGSAGSKRGGR